tara:strand:- start:6662 stop:8443 length:1782 start_codon:yes stop_codon:yes gene_type:complete
MAFSSMLVAAEKVTLRDVIEEAALNNPSIQASWHAFAASTEGVRAAEGGYYPKVDLNAEIGRERTDSVQNDNVSSSASSSRLTITQMLFDGFATKQEVAKQGYIKLARYYEFLQASEEIALEVSQAALDVARLRELVALARSNHQEHKKYYINIEKRAQSGVGRGVDLEQAGARLALSESNLLTEITNLHDVSARFQRLVGLFPSENLSIPDTPVGLIPNKRYDALRQAFAMNPQLNAAIERIRAARADVNAKKAPMSPRFDVRFRKQLDENDRGIDGRFDEEAVELVMTYNFYNGGSDSARKRQSNHLYHASLDDRERVCREVRQTVSIAYNDISSRATLIGYLERNVVAIAKAREAYKKQFYIGQRTLLDLLDTENEYFEAKRTLVNARNEWQLAKLRTLAGMGLLLRSFKIEGLDSDIRNELDLSREEELSAYCPAEAPAMKGFDLGVEADDVAGDIAALPLAGETESFRLDVRFESQSANLADKGSDAINFAAKIMCDNPSVMGVVEGHTDSVGSESFNFKLSRARAESVLAQIVAHCPAAAGRLRPVGYGELRPVASNHSVDGRSKNRRVELVLPKISKGYSVSPSRS